MECLFYPLGDDYLDQGIIEIGKIKEIEHGPLIIGSDFLEDNVSISRLNSFDSFDWDSNLNLKINCKKTIVKIHIENLNGIYDYKPTISPLEMEELEHVLRCLSIERCLDDVTEKVHLVYKGFSPGKKTRLLVREMLKSYDHYQISALAKMAAKNELYNQKTEYAVYGKHAANRVINSLEFYFKKSLESNWKNLYGDCKGESMAELIIKKRLDKE